MLENVEKIISNKSKEHTIYLIGVSIFAVFYEFLDALLGNLMFVGLALIYAITLNVIAHKFGKDKDKNSDDTLINV